LDFENFAVFVMRFVGMAFCFLVKNFADIGQSVNELWLKSDFQDGGRRHLEFLKFQFLVMLP